MPVVSRFTRALTVIALVVIAFPMAGCMSKPDDPQRAKLELLLSGATGPDADRRTIIARQYEFLTAAARKSPAMSDYLDMGVVMFDADAPQVQTMNRRQRPGEDYFAVLSKLGGRNLIPERANVKVYTDGYAVSIAFPPHQKPIVLSWTLHKKVWKVDVIQINASDEAVQNALK